MSNALKIATTNWIHLPGFYITAYLTVVFFKIFGIDRFENWTNTLFLTPIMILLLFLTYGLIIIVAFFTVIVVLDFMAFKWTKLAIVYILLLEWTLIIPPFIYWAFKYDYWLWLTLALSFLVTQFYRKRQIEKIKITLPNK